MSRAPRRRMEADNQGPELRETSASDLVGRPGLDPGTLGLKVLVRELRRVA